MLFDDDPPPFDLPAYLERIGLPGPGAASLELLTEVQRAHLAHIPFENLDVMLGKAIRLDRASLHAKLIAGRRGGYCFEQNLVLADALEALGFAVTRLAARVRLGAHHVTPRAHMLLRVDVAGQPYLVDVGFGSLGVLSPLPLIPGPVCRQGHWNYRLQDEGPVLALQMESAAGWLDLYAFTLEPHYFVDYQVANLFIFAHPDSPFVRTATVQRAAPAGRVSLRGLELSIDRGTDISTRQLADEDELLQVVHDQFGLSFPPGTRFHSQVERLQSFLFGH